MEDYTLQLAKRAAPWLLVYIACHVASWLLGTSGWGLVVMLLQGAVCLRLVAVPGLAYIRGRDLLTRQELTHEERGGQLGIALGAFALIVIVNIMTP